MKKLNLSQTTFILLLIFNLLSLNVQSQNSYIKKRWSIKTGYARYETGAFFDNKAEKTGQLLLEANYGVFNFLEAGIYTGIGKFWVYGATDNPNLFEGISLVTPFYGINANFHILPFFIKADDFRFDLYLNGKIGAQYFDTGDNFYYHGNKVEYGIGAGASFYPWKHLGLYVEYSYGEYFYSEDKDLLRYGINFKF